MYFGYKKFLILAIIGSLIIGLSLYLYLNNYFEKVSISVLKNDLRKGDIIREEDITDGNFYKQDVPPKVIKNKSDLVGLEIKTDRFKGDFITTDMLSYNKEDVLTNNLGIDESIMPININSSNNILANLNIGTKIIVVSTEKEEDMEELLYKNEYIPYLNKYFSNNVNSRYYLNNSVIQLSENIFLVDGFIFFKNLEIVQIKENEKDEVGVLSNNSNLDSIIYIKCRNLEAAYLAKVTSSENYKILFSSQ